METEDRDKSARLSLELRLEERGDDYRFFPVVRLLERLTPNAPRLGGTGPYVEEAIRFRAEASLGYQPAEVKNIKVPSSSPRRDNTPEGGVFEVTTTFFGPSGATSPLPTYILEELVPETVEGERRREFLDLFHHRLMGLFYRAVVRHDYPAEYRNDADDEWSERVLALAGFADDPGRRFRHLGRHELLRLSPLLVSMVRSEEVLKLALSDILGDALDGATVEIETMTGGWKRLGDVQQAKLGLENHRLGEDMVLGDRCFDRSGKAKVVLRGVGEHNFRRFMPDGDKYPVLLEVLDLFVRDPVQVELELVLDRATRPSFTLGLEKGATLGANTWLSAADSDDTRVRLDLPTAREAVP